MGVQYSGKRQWLYSHILCPSSHKRDLSNPAGKSSSNQEQWFFSDKFSLYFNLNAIGYTHVMVNHSENFVHPYTAAHTNTIELIWNAVKKKLNGGINDQFCVQQSCTLFPWECWFNNRGPITLLLNRPIRPGVPFNLQQRKLRPPLCGGVSTIMWFSGCQAL